MPHRMHASPFVRSDPPYPRSRSTTPIRRWRSKPRALRRLNSKRTPSLRIGATCPATSPTGAATSATSRLSSSAQNAYVNHALYQA
ncbi:hypothetical protein EXIGLDRAFT_53353 [Exidia glandulosa HHB12029]|uniref:Uncharacterized protein n=1 Tax=Exidia glandulosa HHB12029 TaxID=1314781 RepID=A0A165IC55_EXIGL|nr:hypothetical protein EXIGLDRAFT_53353 [Exidia glandulosa HHB12029]